MEIVTTPSLPAPSVGGRLLAAIAVLAPVTVLGLLPVALGLDRYVVSGSTATPAYERGTLLLERAVPAGELTDGDVITFRPPETQASVTRRVDRVQGGVVRTRLDATTAPDPWRLRPGAAPVHRVVLALPLVGYPYLALSSGGRPLTVAVVVATVGLVAAVAVGRRRGRGTAT